MTNSAFNTPPQTPPNFDATPEELISNTRAIIDKTRSLQDAIIASVPLKKATLANVLLPLAHDENASLCKRKISKFYSSTSTSAELREASNASEALFTAFDSETLMRKDLFELVHAVFERRVNLDNESQFYLEYKHREFARNGMGIIESEKQKRFAQIKVELHEKLIASRKSINSSSGIWLGESELDGVPDNIRKGLKKGEGEKAGKLWLPFKKPHYDAALKYAKNPTTRKKIYVGNDNRCPDNVPRVKEIVLLRDETARLLGYENHAEYQLEVKMAGSTGFVNDFLSGFREKLTMIARKELEALKALKAQNLEETALQSGVGTDTFFTWDYNFYSNISKAQNHSFDEKKFSEYFTLEKSLAGMMTTFSRLFGLQFVEIKPDENSTFGNEHVMTWHDSVSVFTLWEGSEDSDACNQGEFVGYLYLDLFPRDHKFNHAGHYLLQPGYFSEDGEYHYPSSALVMNLPTPQPGKPTLLSHDSTRSLFHELGHAIHNLVSRTQFAIFHGTATTRDFVEIPSIMLENWWWTPSVIKELGCHYSYISEEMLKAWEDSEGRENERPAEKLDDQSIQNLVATRRSNEALATLKQCHFAIFDMAIHSPSSREEVEGMNLSQMWNQTMSDITLMSGLEVEGEGWEWGHGCARIGAYIRGYDAGYYAYPLGKAYAQDLFKSMFEVDPMSKEVGMRYRRVVLEKGGSRNGMELLEDFLGRKPNAAARYEELGLAGGQLNPSRC
ncbi:zincin [Mollisia scopiformis]|uniref:Zincin n=1 Tax=Mollisia scopiformis TaxID=149040 RepID=A0A194XHS3_MOLSC|nr:zincin [Mollisia scopiformis]KUJ19679.1 zincin [Mollisia scopiformis]